MTIEEQLNDAEWRLELALAQLEAMYKRTCESCKHHFSQTTNYGNCERNGTPTPTEYSWFCAGWEAQDV